MAEEWTHSFSNAWLVYREPLTSSCYMYACKRPEGYDFRAKGFPWAHVYVMKGQPTDEESGEDIEHFKFNDVSPLELCSVMHEMRSKYGGEA